jgi:hypothetical protein
MQARECELTTDFTRMVADREQKRDSPRRRGDAEKFESQGKPLPLIDTDDTDSGEDRVIARDREIG